MRALSIQGVSAMRGKVITNLNEVDVLKRIEVDSLPTASLDTMGAIYIVEEEGVRKKYVTYQSTESESGYAWRFVGNEEIDDIENIAPDIYSGYTDYWNNRVGYIPREGEIIIYLDYKATQRDGQTVYVPGIKIGSGNAYVQDLAFIDEAVSNDLLAHIQNTTVHITAQERINWNNKLNVDDNAEVVNESLILNRN